MPRIILVADDEKTNRDILKKLLGEDYIIMEAGSGEEAMTLLMGNHQSISAVLLDILMPAMDGFQVLERMRSNPSLSQIPVIVITGSTEPDTEERAMSLGAMAFLNKPFTPGAIRHRLDNLIRLRESSALVNGYQRDRLTGLWNRDTFIEKASRFIKRRPEGYYAISRVDIDGFKMINDQYGSERGDLVLTELARIIGNACESGGGVCGRLSADNFATLYPVKRMEKPQELNRRLAAVELPGHDQPLTLSVGQYVAEDKSIGVGAMLDRAKIALGTVKGRYDVHFAVYDEAMRQQLMREQEIISQMDTALAQGQFEPWFQPQYNHATGALVGAEALARWRHPGMGLLSPLEFISIFEKNGFIYQLDKCIWDRTCACLRSWIDQGLEPVPVSVNISRYDLFKEDLVEVIVGLTERYGISEELLRLEITESAFAHSQQRLVRTVEQLVGHGFTVEIDDFGSGYSSLNTLKDVPAQILKLDMHFFDDSDNQDRGGNILESVVRMSKWLGMSVIAEGVEKGSQADYLKSIGCCYIQGFLYARPMPEADYARLLREGKKEERLIALETVENLDNNSFWDPESMDTLIFSSYVGAACIFEYNDGEIELVRATDKLARILCGEDAGVDRALRLELREHLDQENMRRIRQAVSISVDAKDEVAGDYLFHHLPGRPEQVYLHCSMRVIATSGERRLVYTLVEDNTAQLEAEHKRLAVSQQLRLFTDNIPGGLARYMVDRDGLRLLMENDGLYRLSGYSKDEYEARAGVNPMSLVFPEDLSLVEGLVDQIRGGQDSIDCLFRMRTKDGGFHWVNLRGLVTERQEDSAVANVLMLDVTELKTAMERLRVSETEYRLAVERSGRMIYRYNHADNSVDLTESVVPLFGLERHLDNVPESLMAGGLVAEESIEQYREFYRAIKRGDRTGSMTIRRLTANGSWRWFSGYFNNVFDDSGRPISAIVVFLDVTEQQEKEAVYKRWQQSMEDRAPEDYSLFHWNLNKDRMMGAQEGSLLSFRVTGDDRFTPCTRRFADSYVFQEDRERYVAFVNADAMMASFYRGRRIDTLEYRELRPAGQTRWLRLTVELVEYPNSTDICAYLMYENIDDRKREELLVHKQAELDPLTGVLNRVTFTAKAERGNRDMPLGMQSALMMLDVDGFKSLNDSFGHGAGDQALVEIADKLRSILRPDDLLGRLGGDEFMVWLKNMPSESFIEKKAEQICSMLHKDYSPEVRLTASIGISVFPRDGGDFSELYRKADTAMYWVKNSGKDDYAIYKAEMDERSEERPSREEAALPPAKRAEPGKRRLLIAEDNGIDAELLSAMFRDDFVIEKAKNGTGALMLLRYYGSAISVVLMDLLMPGMDGFEMLETMRMSEEMRSIPVIVVSGSGDRETILRAIRAGATDYITKPVDPEIIRVRVHSAISRAENERLRAQNSHLSLQSAEVQKYRAALEGSGTVVIEHDWKSGEFRYDRSISRHIAGNYDGYRRLWAVLLSDFVTDAREEQAMQRLEHDLANDRSRSQAAMTVSLNTPGGERHRFRLNMSKIANEFQLTERIILTFRDLEGEAE